jgi:hypothetical protein
MSLVWHIVRKDFRRLAGPLALWLVLLLGHVSLLFFREGQVDSNSTALESTRYFVNTCGAIVLGIGFILAAWLVMEDSLVSTTAFWRTHALSGARLLAAKTLGALLMFSVLPAVVLTPVWLGCGFSARELGHAAWELFATQALCSLTAFALGAITETSGQFLVRLIGGFIVLPVYLFYVRGDAAFMSSWQYGEVSPEVREARHLLVLGLLGLIPLGMALHQFLTRRTRRTWFLFLTGLGLLLLAGRCWPWGFPARGNQQALANDQATVPGFVFTADKFTVNTLQQSGRNFPVAVEGRVTAVEPGQQIRVDAVQTSWTGRAEPRSGPRLTGAVTNGQPTAAAVRAVAGLPATRPGPTAWAAIGSENSGLLELALTQSWQLRGTVQATVLRGEALGELPLVAGAELRSGSSFTRINSIKWVDDKLVVLIEERDAWLTADSGAYSHSYDPAKRRTRPAADSFLILHRPSAFDQLPGVEDIGTIKADSIVFGRRSLVITPPDGAGAEWLAGAVLVKVRFAPVATITRPLAGDALTPTR